MNARLRTGINVWSALLAILFAATLAAAIHVALGLVFDPRYKDFQLALLSGPVFALAVAALLMEPVRPLPGIAEWVAAGALSGSALFVMFNEGIANWQALWFGGLLLLLAFTAWRATPARS
jgi:glucan 1,3-beta-glucosidase